MPCSKIQVLGDPAPCIINLFCNQNQLKNILLDNIKILVRYRSIIILCDSMLFLGFPPKLPQKTPERLDPISLLLNED